MTTKSFIMKHIFVARVAKKVKLSTWKTEKVIDTIMREIRQAVDEGKSVKFNMIGTFSPGVRAKRSYHNPQTGKIEESPPMFVPKFKMSKKWRKLFDERVRAHGWKP